MTTDPDERRHKMAALLEEAFDSGALVFSEPLLEALKAAALEIPGEVRSEHGIAYEIEHELGRGGMATVYLARDPKHDRRIAIKVLHAELTARVGAERFVREIRLTARLQHPHVLGLLDSGVFDRDAGILAGRLYSVMPYVEGESLRARLTRDGALPLRDAVRVLREIADALSYAHEQGVVHRDIKPENILLSRAHAVVADFGIAKAVAAASRDDLPEGVSPNDPRPLTSEGDLASPALFTQSSTLIGTPAYMAPEQAAQTQVDHRADLYAWGIVAYEVLTGRHPFAGRRSAAELLSAHIAEVPRPICDVAPSVSPTLGALVMSCLQKVPADRPDAAAEVVAALDSAAIGARTDSRSILGVRHRARRGVTAALGTVLIFVAAILYAKMTSHPVTEQKTVVVGTGNAAIDIAAVQAAVNHADTVVLDGRFSFRRAPTMPVDPILASAKASAPRAAQILVSKPVTISGVRDTSGGMTTIDGGTIPFYVDAPGARVTIRGLRFVQPVKTAILVLAARDVEIAANRIEGLERFGGAGEAISINTSGDIPTPGHPGSPDAISGILTIHENDIDLTGATAEGSGALGIRVFSVGQARRGEVTLDIIGNRIRNTTSTAIMVRRATGHVRILGNLVTTSSEVASTGHEAVRLVNTGSYLMANNTIECRWADCVGIAVFSQFGDWPMRRAVVENNQVNMLPPAGAVFADSSAAIEIKGFADSNVVRNNTIRGRARTALGIDTFRGGVPEDNAFVDNHVDAFHAYVANAVVGTGVLRTRLVRAGTVDNHGEGTRIER
jgi:serine/threonine protein kinase